MEKHEFQNWLFGIGLGVLLTATAAVAPAAGQDADEEPPIGWSQSLIGGLNLSQSEFENFAEGGESSLTWNLNIDYEALENREKREWKTTLELQFGQTRLGDGDFRKAADKIELDTVHNWKTGGFVDPYVAGDARSQFAKSFEYTDDMRGPEISRFANPLYLSESAGVIRRFNPWLTSRLGGAVEEVFVTEEQFAPAYTDDPETAELEKSRIEPGLESVTEFDREWEEEKIKFKSKLKLFAAFENMDKIDIYWTTKFTANLVSIVDVILETTVIYDENILSRTQFKEVLALGITHKFM